MKTLSTESVILTGIKPTGLPHIGNYLGMIQPSLELAQNHQALYFIADYHALTTMRDPRQVHRRTHELAATWLALGLDPQQVIFYRQSAIPEIFEIMWVLCCMASKGLLNRAHAYKAAVQSNSRAGRDADTDINAGLFNYPMLMAADILTFGANWVPVGSDQQQHVEIARDVAGAFNITFGEVFKKPRALINDDLATVPGLDGRKMSKSYGNDIPVLASPEELRQKVMRIVTDSRRPEEVKDPEQCNLYRLYCRFAPPNDVERVRTLYLHGGISYKTVKEELISLLELRFAIARNRFDHNMNHPEKISRILNNGATTARILAGDTLSRVRKAVGVIES